MVMATGIVSIACFHVGFQILSYGLFFLNLFFYLCLWVLTVFRLVLYPHRAASDLNHHIRGPGYFTIIAGTSIVGSQFELLLQAHRTAALFLIAAFVFWCFLVYSVFALLSIRKEKPAFQEGINGNWLIASVATHSLSVLSAVLHSSVSHRLQEPLLLFSLSMLCIGWTIYLKIIGIIFERFMLFPIRPEDLTPPYWINMGALAIATLAGSRLVLSSTGSRLLEPLLPFTAGFTILFWATATWWIPMLLILGYWRHVSNRFPLRYDPLYWGAVFPLGMYTVSTRQLSEMLGLTFILWIPRLFVWIALAAWGATFAGLVHRFATTMGGSANQTRREPPG